MRNTDGSLFGVTAYRPVGLGGMGYTTGIVTAPDESWQLVKTDGAGAWRSAFIDVSGRVWDRSGGTCH